MDNPSARIQFQVSADEKSVGTLRITVPNQLMSMQQAVYAVDQDMPEINGRVKFSVWLQHGVSIETMVERLREIGGIDLGSITPYRIN